MSVEAVRDTFAHQGPLRAAAPQMRHRGKLLLRATLAATDGILNHATNAKDNALRMSAIASTAQRSRPGCAQVARLKAAAAKINNRGRWEFAQTTVNATTVAIRARACEDSAIPHIRKLRLR